MDGKKFFDGTMKVVALVYLLVLIGFIEIAALVYLLVLIGWLVKALYRGFIIGQDERMEYKARELAWKKEPVHGTASKDKDFDLAEVVSE